VKHLDFVGRGPEGGSLTRRKEAQLSRVSLVRRVGATLAVAMLLVSPGIAAAQGGGKPSAQQRATTLASPAVVFINTEVSGRIRLEFFDIFTNRPRAFNTSFTFPWGSGSGFGVSPDGTIVTAGHVVQPSMEDVETRLANELFENVFPDYDLTTDPYTKYKITDNTFIRNLLNQCYSGRACDFNVRTTVDVLTAVNVAGTDVAQGQEAEILGATGFSETDVAVVKINTTNLPTINLSQSSAQLTSGDEIVALGFPGSAQNLPSGITEPQKAFGRVSNVRSEGTSQVVEVDADFEGGFSGGPAINNSGQVIGIVSFALLTTEGEAAQEYLRPAEDIRAGLSAAGVEPQQGPVDSAFREAMELFWDNHFSAAVPKFREVTSLAPGHPLATQYLSDAQAKAGTAQDVPVEEEGGGLPLIPILIGVGAVVVIVIVVLLVMSRRKQAPAAAPAGYGAAPAGPAGYEAPAGQAPPAAAPPSSTPMAAPTQAPPGQPAGGPPQAAPPQAAPAGQTAAPQQPRTGEAAPPPPGIGQAKFCSNCGMENASDATYCARCGHTLG
jgi:serine protease Do